MVECQEAPSHGKKIWKFTCSASRPFQTGSVDKVLPIFEVCIFMGKTELWKNTARRDADFYRPMSNLFFISKILSVTIFHWVSDCHIDMWVPQYLVGGLDFFLFFHSVGNGMSSSQLLLIPSFFRGVGIPPTSYIPCGKLPHNCGKSPCY